MKFNKIYENIFKPASEEEVRERKAQVELEEFKEKIEEVFGIKYEDLLKKENINKQDKYGNTALIFASYKGYKDIVKQLIEAGADVNIKHYNNNTALMRASMTGHTEIIKLLLDKGADPNIRNNDEFTALEFAMIHNYENIAKLLRQYGAKE